MVAGLCEPQVAWCRGVLVTPEGLVVSMPSRRAVRESVLCLSAYRVRSVCVRTMFCEQSEEPRVCGTGESFCLGFDCVVHVVVQELYLRVAYGASMYHV